MAVSRRGRYWLGGAGGSFRYWGALDLYLCGCMNGDSGHKHPMSVTPPTQTSLSTRLPVSVGTPQKLQASLLSWREDTNHAGAEHLYWPAFTPNLTQPRVTGRKEPPLRNCLEQAGLWQPVGALPWQLSARKPCRPLMMDDDLKVWGEIRTLFPQLLFVSGLPLQLDETALVPPKLGYEDLVPKAGSLHLRVTSWWPFSEVLIWTLESETKRKYITGGRPLRDVSGPVPLHLCPLSVSQLLLRWNTLIRLQPALPRCHVSPQTTRSGDSHGLEPLKPGANTHPASNSLRLSVTWPKHLVEEPGHPLLARV